MYPLFNSELARHHQADLARAAMHERMSRQMHKRTYRSPFRYLHAAFKNAPGIQRAAQADAGYPVNVILLPEFLDSQEPWFPQLSGPQQLASFPRRT
jgi:hypothetical protein